MTEKGKIYALKTFKSKDKKTDYYVCDCLVMSNNDTAYLKGLCSVSVFIDEPMYNSLLSCFEPLIDVELGISLAGNRVNYTLNAVI